MQFDLLAKDENSSARAGIIHTDHGSIETPIFMPVGTAGTVKAVHQRELTNDVKAQIILGNTYHLYLRPGTDVLENAGGLHKFNGWNKPILTDSGGYQVFSLSSQRKIKENGVTFKSHIDGSSHLFTPERAMEIQRSIGGDIVMAFDECAPYPCTYAYARNSMEMTHRWLDRCIAWMAENPPIYGHRQFLFPIVQGSVFPDLREESAAYIASRNMFGNAIGGLSVGEPAEMMYEHTERVNKILPQHKPRYLMGVGTPENILTCIGLGVDMFDCVMPTRNGRNGMLFTSEGIINIKNEKWKFDNSPIDAGLEGYVSQNYSKSYLRHLFISKEYLGLQIASIQNLSFYLYLVRQARQKIINQEFASWKDGAIRQYMNRL
ncbi:MAG TPA: tRNA guanosine(34) transglycosylase Tgt [Catalimonadaceae bacterium]|nr:tRNA guanosine(34) transglycosylase Tgt [Catalimonadaceae bacterium]HPI10887.1 tRNA guanosine(34) transglycosylase Tgt [Catalimonadaceae bacterium]